MFITSAFRINLSSSRAAPKRNGSLPVAKVPAVAVFLAGNLVMRCEQNLFVESMLSSGAASEGGRRQGMWAEGRQDWQHRLHRLQHLQRPVTYGIIIALSAGHNRRKCGERPR